MVLPTDSPTTSWLTTPSRPDSRWRTEVPSWAEWANLDGSFAAVRLGFQIAFSEVHDDANALIIAFDAAVATAEALAARNGPRWHFVPYEALLESGPAPSLVRRLTEAWLASSPDKLKALLTVALRLARPMTDLSVGDSRVDQVVTGPIVDMLSEFGAQLPAEVRPRAQQLLYLHLSALDVEQLGPEGSLRAEGLIRALIEWAQTPSDEDERLACLLILAASMNDEQLDALMATAREDPRELGKAIEDPFVAAAAARWRPELLLALSGCYYLGQELFVDPNRPPVPCGRRPQSNLGWISGDEDGIRDHAPGLPLASADKGPFARLLESEPAAGRRLIGVLVDTATRGRIRTEARHGVGAASFELNLPAGGTRRYTGTGDVWCWFRASTMGPYPAISAMLALHEWAASELATRPIEDVVTDVLECGESLAFVAVAWAVIVEALPGAERLIDPFLIHPLLWHYETGRLVHENSILAPPLPEESRLRWTTESAVMEVVIRCGDEERLRELKAVGDQLLANLGEITTGAPAEAVEKERLVLRRWATALDGSSYTAEVHEETGGIAISVGLPEDVAEGLQATGGDLARDMLALYALVVEAAELRDSEENGALATDEAATIFDRAKAMWDTLEDDSSASPVSVWDAALGASAVLLRRAAIGLDVEDGGVRASAEMTVRFAASMVEFNPLIDDIRGSVFDLSADRSAAVALPLLLDPALLDRSGVTLEDVRSALLAMATSPFAEVRSRLVKGLMPVLDMSTCSSATHEVALEVLEEMVLTSGRGPWNQSHRPRCRLAGLALEDMSPDTMGLDVAGAGDAIAGLVALADTTCEHADRARALLDVLLEYDRLVWPAHLARHHYSELGPWRNELDTLIAIRALDGDARDLDAHLAAFSLVAEDLVGVLRELAARADTEARGVAVHNLWPHLLDQLLPASRDLSGPDGAGHPYWRSVVELDRALLLAPTGIPPWPWDRFWPLLGRWIAAYVRQPQVADRLMTVLASVGALYYPQGTAWVLSVLGNDAELITRESALAAHWLRGVFLEHPDAAADLQVLHVLLDELAMAGSQVAFALQQQLEA